jgi:hypothetical protein
VQAGQLELAAVPELIRADDLRPDEAPRERRLPGSAPAADPDEVQSSVGRQDASLPPRPRTAPSRGAYAGGMKAAAGLALAVLVAGVTAAVDHGAVSVGTLAASPRAFADGKVWLLVTNASVAQRPVILSLVSLAILAVATPFVCGVRVFVASAVVGHVGSTLLVYGLVGALFAVDPALVRSVVDLPDYGVSAIQAAWIGAIAATVWRRHGARRRNRVLVVAGCLAVTGIAVAVRSDLTLLDVDHIFAFGIGVCFAGGGAWLRAASRMRTAASGAAALLALAFVLVSVDHALAHLPLENGPSVARETAASLAASGPFADVACFYVAPHVRCRASMLSEFVSGVVGVTLTVHRTGENRGYYRLCVTSFDLCQDVRFG